MINMNHIPECWAYAQAAQAAFLLDIVVEHMFDKDLD
jgi:hypothetical protein